jgi:hypothetical protein
MSDYVVLKRLTLNSDLGWFKSIFEGHALRTKQKAITLNKEVMNAIYPSLLTRQNAYERHKAAQDVAKGLGAAGRATFDSEKAKAHAVGTLPVQVDLHGPGGKPPIGMDRIIALQDKNWRLNGDFVLTPSADPTRFFPILQEGDLALIGFEGITWPRATTVLLLSQKADAALWGRLQGLVKKGLGSMIQMDPAGLAAMADSLSLPKGHILRLMAGSGGPVPAPSSTSTIPTSGITSARSSSTTVKPVVLPTTTPAQLAAKLATAAKVGEDGEKMVNAHLATTASAGQPVHTWVSQTFAEHPYDFELLADDGTVRSVIDAKATSQGWGAEFHMSAGEVRYAAGSSVPYHIYRVTVVSSGRRSELYVSEDIRGLAATIAGSLFRSPPPGTRATAVAIHPVYSGISWSPPVALPPPPP